LHLAFETPELRSLCIDETIAKAQLGITVSESLKLRLADIRAVRTLAELSKIAGVAPRPSKMFSVDLADGYGILLSVNHMRKHQNDSVESLFASARRAKIVEIETP
jgi:hypothetical protein